LRSSENQGYLLTGGFKRLSGLDALSESLEKDTVLVTMAAVNYMVGTIQPVKD